MTNHGRVRRRSPGSGSSVATSPPLPPGLPAQLRSLVQMLIVMVIAGCARPTPKAPAPVVQQVQPFAFQITSGSDQYHIEGFVARPAQPGRLPALLVLNG